MKSDMAARLIQHFIESLEEEGETPTTDDISHYVMGLYDGAGLPQAWAEEIRDEFGPGLVAVH